MQGKDQLQVTGHCFNASQDVLLGPHRVNQPMIEHFGKSFSTLLHFE